MPRQRDPKRDEAFEIFKKHNGDIQNREIARILDVPEKTISGWKSKDKWNDKLNGVLQKNERSTPKKRGGQPGNKNALGHGPPKGNQNALKHGFFSKYIPEETLEIMGMLEEKSPADLIYDQIMIQYAAIIRAQQIMFVSDQDDLTKELRKEKNTLTENMEVSEKEYEIQFAWDKHATFMNAQSRAMSELRSLIKQFNELAHENDERRLKLEQMRLGIEKTKAEVDKISSGSEDKPIEILIKRKSKGDGS
ncbi:phage terminase small subunit [Bacillus smithii]|uniref:phage terminase small subunit n=1 Tax=Bacillus smithii TaxID=1479 RepID=UPI003D254DFF